MKEFRSRQSGRYIFNEDIHNLQELALSMTEMFKDGGVNFVISGCAISISEDDGLYGTSYIVSVASGYVWLGGKIRKVSAFQKTLPAIPDAIGLKVSDGYGPQITYVGGNTDYQYDEYGVEVITEDEHDSNANGYLYAENNGSDFAFPNLRTAYFAHYCILNNGTAGHLDSLLADEIDVTTLKIGGTNVNSLFVKKAGDTMDSGVSLTFTNGNKSTVVGPTSISVGGSIAGETLSLTGAASIGGNLTADAIIKVGGLSTEFLKADGSVDDNEYVTSDALDRFLPLTGGVMSGSLRIVSNLSVDGNATVAGNCTISNNLTVLDTIASVDATLTGTLQTLGFKASNAEITNDLTVGDMTVSGTAEIGGALTTTSTATIGGDTTVSGEVTATKFVKTGGTSSQFLKADGSIDSRTFLVASDISHLAAASALQNYMPLSGGTMYDGDYYLKLEGSAVTIGHLEGTAKFSLTAQDRYLKIESGEVDIMCNIAVTGSVTASSFIKSGGTSSQFLKADGSVDSNTYVTTSQLGNYFSSNGGTIYANDHYIKLLGNGITIGHLEGQATLALTAIDRYLGISASAVVINCNTSVSGSVTASSFVKSGGTSSQFLKADGSVDNHTYLTSSSLSNYVTTSMLSSYATVSSLANYATVSSLANYATVGALANYFPADGGTIYYNDNYVTIRGGGITIGHIENSTTLAPTAIDRYLGINNHVVVQGSVTATSFPTSSDARLKVKVSDVMLSAQQIAEAPAINFKWKDSKDNDVHAGTIAQYWQEILPAVIMNRNNNLVMDYGPAAMVAVINLAKEVVSLKQEIERLKQ